MLDLGALIKDISETQTYIYLKPDMTACGDGS